MLELLPYSGKQYLSHVMSYLTTWEPGYKKTELFLFSSVEMSAPAHAQPAKWHGLSCPLWCGGDE